MKTKIILSLLIAVGAVALFVGIGFLKANLLENVQAQSAAPPQIPDFVLYESLFRMNLSFHRKAMEQELTGQPTTLSKTYFKKKVGLSDAEDETLYQTSLEYLQEIQPVNDQATQILAQIREQFPDGYVPDGQQIPPPPQALADLQS